MSMEKQVTIPSDVMIEIFSWLPARSLGRFRSVSKLYYRLLSQPFFIQKHLLHGGVSSDVKFLVQMSDGLSYGMKKWFIYYPFSSFDKNLTLHGSEIKYPWYPNPSNLSLLGSCNGLFCVEDDDNNLVMLWNPTTREICYLPGLPKTKLNNIRSGEVTIYHYDYDYAFGYDSLNEDYKVICVMTVSQYKKIKNKCFKKVPSTKTYIYSHRSRCWKEIQPFPHYNIREMTISYWNSMFVHNKVHWVPYSLQDGKVSQLIVSLDLATETYGALRQPNCHQRAPGGVLFDDSAMDLVGVSDLGGELCVYINYENDFQVWMMKEYGVEQSWCHVLSISGENLVFSFEKRKAICVPWFLMESGEVLLQATEFGASSIYLYNPRTCSFITVYSGPDNACVLWGGYTYVESLVSLK